MYELIQRTYELWDNEIYNFRFYVKCNFFTEIGIKEENYTRSTCVYQLLVNRFCIGNLEIRDE